MNLPIPRKRLAVDVQAFGEMRQSDYLSRFQVFFERYIFSSRKQFFLSIFLPLTLIYGATASWELPQDPDTITNAVTAWHLGNHLSPFLPGYEKFTAGPQASLFFHFVMGHEAAVAQYPPGAALLAAPFYFVASNSMQEVNLSRPSNPEVASIKMLLPSFWQATLVAVISTAAAIAFIGLVFLSQGLPKEAWIASWVAGLGTSAWSIASDMLWQHGPAMLWIAVGLFMAIQPRWWSSGLALGAAVLTRPHTAVIPACLGFASAFQYRSFAPILKLGLASFLGVLALLVYNYYVFRSLSVSGGYGSHFTDNLIDADIMMLARNLLGGMLDPRVGLLIWSPFLLVLLPGILQGWRQSDWVLRGAAIGGVIYLLLQFKMNRYRPGYTVPYRYPLEAITAAAPL
ncbi:MAG: hypothetical protein ACLFS2_10240, partial [Halochromatium sp.]|uniref:hypothetical protein n=1 Tax=Halochromatium sp. TaxID=2049430 RepID=UPI0039793CDE